MPRMGIGMPLTGSRTSETVLLLVDDPLFENIVGSTLNINYTQFTFNDALHSQDSTNAVWAKTNANVSGTLVEAPDNSGTANSITNSDNNSNAKSLAQNVAIGAGKTYSVSVHLKKGAFNFARLKATDGTNSYFADFNLTTGAVGTSSGIISSDHTKIDGSLGGGGWIRCSITFQALAGSDNASSEENTPGTISAIAMSADNTTNVQVAVGTTILMNTWGWQIEQDIQSSNYQKTVASVARKTTNLVDNHKTWDLDGANLMPDSNPRPEGSWTRPSTGQLVTNGGFDTDSNWTKGTNVTISGGKGNWANSPNNNGLIQSDFITIGNTYEFTFTVSNYSSGSVRVRFPFIGTDRTANGTYTEIGVATTDDLYIQGQDKSGTTSTFSIDSVSVREYAITPVSTT